MLIKQKETFIESLQDKLSKYHQSSNNLETNSLKNKLKDIENSLNGIKCERQSERDEISKIEVCIKSQKEQQLNIISEIYKLEKEYKSDLIEIKKEKLINLNTKKEEINNNLLLKTAQLNSINDEIKRRDQMMINNLDLLLKRAKLLEIELNDPNYYNLDDKIRISRLYHSNSATNDNAKNNKSLLIKKSKLKFENEQNEIKQNIQTLINEKKLINEKLESYKNEKNENNQLQNDDILSFDILKIEENINKLKNDLIKSDGNNNNNNNNMYNNDNLIFFNKMKKYLMDAIISPFCNRYILEENDINQKKLKIEFETKSIDKDFKIWTKKQNQFILNQIFGEIEMELINEIVLENIENIYIQFYNLYLYSQQLTHKLLINSMNRKKKQRQKQQLEILSNYCLKQLIFDRNEKKLNNIKYKRFSLRHDTHSVSTQNVNNGISTKLQKEYEQFENDGFKILFLCELESNFSSIKWIKKEEKYWRENINLNTNQIYDKISTFINQYLYLIATNDGKFIIITTNKGDIFLYHILSKTIIAKTINYKQKKKMNKLNDINYNLLPIKQLIISENNAQIICLNDIGIVYIYKIDKNEEIIKQISMISDGDLYRPPKQVNKYKDIPEIELKDHEIKYLHFIHI